MVWKVVTLVLFLTLLPAPATVAATGRLLATGGATELEGSAGGGIVPWAVLSSYATAVEWGATGFLTRVDTGDYQLTAFGAAVTWHNRVELSVARQSLELGKLGDRIGRPNEKLRQDIFGIKVRLFGDAVYTAYPQVSAGLMYKHNRDFDIPASVGATHDHGVDAYISATRILVGALAGRTVVVNVTARATKANQLGLLGFGGDRSNDYTAEFEGSLAVLMTRNIAFGIEYRNKPDNLRFAREQPWKDIFVAWFPNKHVSLVGAYADLGDVASLTDQNGAYVSLQVSF